VRNGDYYPRCEEVGIDTRYSERMIQGGCWGGWERAGKKVMRWGRPGNREQGGCEERWAFLFLMCLWGSTTEQIWEGL